MTTDYRRTAAYGTAALLSATLAVTLLADRSNASPTGAEPVVSQDRSDSPKTSVPLYEAERQARAEDLRAILSGESPDLLTVGLALEAIYRPNVDANAARVEFNALVSGLKDYLGDDCPEFYAARKIRLYFFKTMGYEPVTVGNYARVDDLLPSGVLQRRKGYCLGLVYIIVAAGRELNLPLYAAQLPNHCIIRFEGKTVQVNFEPLDNGSGWTDDAYADQLAGRPADIMTRAKYLTPLTDKELIALFLSNLGLHQISDGLTINALAASDVVIEQFPQLVDGYCLRGLALRTLGDPTGARTAFDAALTIDPFYSPAIDGKSKIRD
ncbi:MAG: transglutaminase family protein [Planctomycetota bacterium]